MKFRSRDGKKAYLGDEVYVTEEYGQVVIWTSDGLNDSTRIYLEPEVWNALVRWHAQLGQGEPANDGG